MYNTPRAAAACNPLRYFPYDTIWELFHSGIEVLLRASFVIEFGITDDHVKEISQRKKNVENSRLVEILSIYNFYYEFY
jgi:hypothetical protein